LWDAKNLYAINVFEQTALVLKAVFQKFSGFFSIIRVQVSGRSAGRQGMVERTGAREAPPRMTCGKWRVVWVATRGNEGSSTKDGKFDLRQAKVDSFSIRLLDSVESASL